MQTMTRLGLWLRGILTVAAAVSAYLTNDPTFRSTVPPLALTAVGALAVGSVTLRAFLDQSPTQHANTERAEEAEAKADAAAPAITDYEYAQWRREQAGTKAPESQAPQVLAGETTP